MIQRKKKDKKKKPQMEITYTEQEMRDFVARWEKNHSLGRSRYAMRIAAYVGLGYVVLLGFAYPIIMTGTLAYLGNTAFYINFIFPFLVALGSAYYAGVVIFKDNEVKYRAFETVLERYGAAWDWILQENEDRKKQKQKPRQGGQKRRKEGKK